MSANSNAQRLAVVPGAEELGCEPHARSIVGEQMVCSFCYRTGMEVLEDK
jgi:hypothetical protein